VALGQRLAPSIPWLACDLNRDTTADAWRPMLDGVDVVVNCAGILQDSHRDDMRAVHHRGPASLFQACADTGIRRVIQISAIGIEGEDATSYADSKRAADKILMGLDLDWVVLRPSLVYARSCYGGTALFRALAAAPLAIPLAEGGRHMFQPIHMDDLVRTVLRFLQPDAPSRILLYPVGPEQMPLRDIVTGLRRWLGLRPAPVIAIPRGIVRVAARIGDLLHWLGVRGSVRTTALRQMDSVNTADLSPFVDAVGFVPRRFADALAWEPAGAQERWHARMIFLRPALRLGLALFWLASATVAAVEPGRAQAHAILSAAGFGTVAGGIALWAG